MNLEEQAGYLQEVKQAADLDLSDPKQRLLSELTDTVSLLCHQIDSTGAVVDGLGESLEEIQSVMEALFEEELESTDGEEMGVDEYFDGSEQPLYEVKCPQCGDRFAVDEGTLSKGFACPTCGEKLMQAE